MDMSDINIRQLTIDDAGAYINLFNSSEKLLKIEKTPEYSNYLMQQFLIDLQHKDKKIIGAFNGNELVCSASGYYPENFLHWYAFNQFSNTAKSDLASFKLSMLIWSKCMYELMSHGEKNSYYSFYSRRPLSHQKAFDRVWIKFANDDLIENKYEYYYEMIYRANEECKSRNHNFFFAGFYNTFDIDTAICLFTLKQNYRAKLLGI